jgi:stage V sporulation protein G
MIQQRVIVAYGEELERSRLPGYVCTYDDYGEDNYARLGEGEELEEVGTGPLILSVGDAIRRRDAAAGQQVPHHLTPARAEVDGASRLAWTGTDDDNFGVGIV